MQLRNLTICCALFFVIGTGCKNKIEDLFTPVVIPPPTEVSDSLYTITHTGLKFFDLEVGTGTLAETGLAVEYHYILWLNDSTLVNSSYLSGRPQVVVLGENSLIPGWSEGLDRMRTGGFRQLKIPPELAYGSDGAASLGVPPDETVFMELALLGVGIPVDAQ